MPSLPLFLFHYLRRQCFREVECSDIRTAFPFEPLFAPPELPPRKPPLHVEGILPGKGGGASHPGVPAGSSHSFPTAAMKSRGGTLPQVARRDLIPWMTVILIRQTGSPPWGPCRGVLALPSEIITCWKGRGGLFLCTVAIRCASRPCSIR